MKKLVAVTKTRTGLDHTGHAIQNKLLTTRFIRSLASDMTQVLSSVLDILVNKIERVKCGYCTLPKPKNLDVRSIILNTNPICKLIQLTIRDSYLGLEILHQSFLGLGQGTVLVIKCASGEDTKSPGP